jgi:hypothetical protein
VAGTVLEHPPAGDLRDARGLLGGVVVQLGDQHEPVEHGPGHQVCVRGGRDECDPRLRLGTERSDQRVVLHQVQQPLRVALALRDPVELVVEQHVAVLHLGQDQPGRAERDLARDDADRAPHLAGDEVRQRGLADAG